MEKFFAKPRLIVLIVLLISAIALPFVMKVKIMNSLEANSVRTDPAYTLIKDIQDMFYTNEETVALAVQTQDSIFEPHNLKYIEDLTKVLNNVENVDHVKSITNLKTMSVTEDEIKIERLKTLSEADRKAIIHHPFYQNLFVSADQKSTLLIITFEPLGKNDHLRRKIFRKVDAVIKNSQRSDVNFYYTGMSYLVNHSNEIVEHDNMTILPAALLLIGLFLYLIYRRKTFVVLPFLITVLAILWTIAIMGTLGRNLTIVTSLVPLVLLTICLCDSVHILNSIWKEASHSGEGMSKRDVIIKGVQKVFMPCLLTSLTTMVGFFALMSSNIISVQEMGGLIGVGVLFAFVLSIAILPIVLFRIDLNKNKVKIDRGFIFFSQLMRSLGEKVLARPWLYLGVGLALSALVIAGISHLTIGQNGWTMYKDKTMFETTNTFFQDNHFGATGEANVVFKANPGVFKDPKVLQVMQTIGRKLESMITFGVDQGTKSYTAREKQPRVYTHKTFSLADALSFISGKDSNQMPPQMLTKAEVDSGLAILELSGDDTFFSREQYMTENGSHYRMRIFHIYGDSSTSANLYEQQIKNLIEKNLPPGITYDITGRCFMWAHMVDYIARSQIKSFALAFILISVMMGLLFRSFRLGLISMIPNMVPILMTLGTLGWLGVDLNSFTAMVACIALGLAVDDTVHFISHFRQKSIEGSAIKEALLDSYENVGFPMLITSSLMAIGFLTFYFSKLQLTTEFGFLISLACTLALLADLFLLPPLLLLTKTRFRV